MRTSTEKLSPSEVVREVCMDCLGMTQMNSKQIRDCQGNTVKCTLFPFRLGKKISIKTFRKYCLYCMGGHRESVDQCSTESCACHPYRLGPDSTSEESTFRTPRRRRKKRV
jgi:hypothetical protein